MGGCEALAYFNGVQGRIAREQRRQLQQVRIVVNHKLHALERRENAQLFKAPTLLCPVPEEPASYSSGPSDPLVIR